MKRDVVAVIIDAVNFTFMSFDYIHYKLIKWNYVLNATESIKGYPDG